MRKHPRTSGQKRPGSVMIMVVALLVLLALMGTAWIASVRYDRSSSAQSVTNNQIDTVAQGVADMLSDAINAGVWGHDELTGANSFYRPRSDNLYLDKPALKNLNVKSYSYFSFDCPIGDATALDNSNVPIDWIEQHAGDFLASRLPEVRDPKVNGGDIVYWPAISAPLGSPSLFSGTSIREDNNGKSLVPTIGNDTTPPTATILDALRWYESPVALYDNSSGTSYHRVAYARRVDMRPAFATATGSDGVTRTYPVFDLTNNMVIYDADTLKSFTPVAVPNKFPIFVVGADADGDGIPDSGLSRLPIGQQGGITYYAAVRVIDNNAALNANTAWQWRSGASKTDADNASSFIPTNITPANINAEALLLDPNKESYDPGSKTAGTWNTWRFNGPLNNSVFSSFNDQGNSGGFSFISYYDALWTQLGARVDNPGQVAAGVRYRAFPLGDHASLASRFLLLDPNAAGLLEQALPTSLSYTRYVTSSNYTLIRSTPYASNGAAGILDYSPILTPGNGTGWFGENFDFDSLYHNNDPTGNRRPLFVTRNGVTNFIAAALPNPDGISPGNQMLNYGPAGDPLAVKADINTGNFEELRRAFWNVMIGQVGKGTNADMSPFGSDDPTDDYLGTKFNIPPASQADQSRARFGELFETHPQRMFRRSIRHPGGVNYTKYDVGSQVEIRAGIAAANAISLREGPGNMAGNVITDHTFIVTSKSNSAKYVVACYGLHIQPYISEIYATNDNLTDNSGKNTTGYVAVELVNPYPFSITLTGWKVATIDRTTFPQLKIVDLTGGGLLDTVTIPAASGGKYGYAVIHNLGDGSNGSAKFVPPAALSGQGTIPNSYFIANLNEVRGKEMVILRPAPQVKAGEANGAWASVDSFDFSGFPGNPVVDQNAVPPSATVTAWHYARANDQAGHPWCFVYPGRYDGSVASRRQQGTQAENYKVLATGQPTPQPGFQDLWNAQGTNGVTINLGGQDATASFPEKHVFTIQVANVTSAAAPSSNAFPFGGFSRNGDILQVPFIGSYRIYTADANGNAADLLEINSISMDSVFAEDTDTMDNPVEQIGRFCPVCPDTTGNTGGPNDIQPIASYSDGSTYPNDWDDKNYKRWRYRWAMRLFDYVTVQDANRDTFPNAPPELSANLPYVSNADPSHPNPNPDNDLYERNIPIQGLLNINTVPELVLRTLPMAYKPGGDLDPNTNVTLAKAIASYRNGDTRVNAQGNFINAPPHGPFRTIYDLYRVPKVWDQVAAIVTGTDPTAADGEFTAQSPNPDGVRRDFEERFLFLTRISNMVTTRSDSFTAYVLVQGWRDAGTPNATLVSQKRLGFIIDRSNLSAKNKKPRMIPFAAQ
jgi:hypothetical protein